MSVNLPTTATHDDRPTEPAMVGFRRCTTSRSALRRAFAAGAVAVAIIGSLAGCKTSPIADRGAGARSQKGAKSTGSAGDVDAAPERAPSELETRLLRIDSMVRDWDTAQNAGRDDAARTLAGQIASEVDRDYAFFEAASRGEKGLRTQNLAVQALAFSRDRGATKLLVERLGDLDGSVIGNALIGLKIRSDPDTPIRPLVKLIRATFPEARRYAPLAFANVVRAREAANRPIDASESDDAMAGLVNLVQDGDPYARLHAAKAMGALRRTDATDFLVLLMKDERATIRIAAAAALERIGDPRSFSSVIALLDRVPDDQKTLVAAILVSFAERLQKRPMSLAERKSLDVSARAWDRWFAARDTSPPPGRAGVGG